jgi:hypothetical protein
VKVNKEKVKERTVGKYSKTTKALLLLGAVVVFVVGSNIVSSLALKQSVEIVKLKSSVPQDGRVIQDNFEKDTMLKSEYEKQGVYTLSDGTKKRAIVLWQDRSRIQNAYASYYIRQSTPLYWDSLSKETPKKYSYLYKMDGELLKIDQNAKEFGKMLVPGDKINIRASYTENQTTLPTERDFQLQQSSGIQTQTTVTRKEKLFDSAVVLDILNSRGESIFDIYYQLLAMPKAQQQATVATDEFLTQVEPSQILLNVTPEEADRYMDLQSKNPQFLMTLLPRTSGNLITEALNELQIGFSRDSK